MMIVLGTMTALMFCFDIALYRAFFYNPQAITVQYRQIESQLIPASMSQVSVVYLTDIEYDAENFGTEKGEALFEKVRSLNPDILLFGGDLFAWNAQLSDEVRGQMSSWISSVPAPLGKFAVYGEQDLTDENHRRIVDDVYHNAQVELINNTSVLLVNQSPEGIRLGGLNIDADPAALSASFLSGQFSLLLSHYPDNLLLAQSAGLHADYALAGNSHGTQINWPLFGGYKQFEGSKTINRNHRPNLNFDYEISNGIGCIDVQARLNSPVEILYLTLYNGS